jgi:CHASE2 domain-containing sensor protein
LRSWSRLEAGALVIALDILLPETREGDEALAAESAKGPTVSAASKRRRAHFRRCL